MPSNLIISRVAGFLGSHTPFDLLEITVIEKISATVEIIYFDNKKIIFREGDTPGPYCYVLRKGQVNLLRKMENKDILMDVCGEGDMFGVRSMLSGENYKLTAIVETEALVYAIPVKQVRTIVDENPEVSRYFAVGLASGQIILGTDQKVKGSVHSINFQFTDQPVGILPYVLDRELITCRPGDKIKDVAEMMAVKGTGSAIVVDKRNFPLGIITDTDLRKQVATGKVVITAPVRSIMSSPVITIRSDQHLGDMVLKMMKAGVHHVCITEDGTNGSPAIGIVSNHDLLMSQGSNPTIVYKAIRKAESLDELKTLYRESEKIIGQYMAGEVPVSYLLEVSSFLRDALTQRSLQLIVNELPGLQHAHFCFVDLGSSARKEQLLKTDLDNLIIYEKGDEELKQSLINAAAGVNEFLAGCGFSFCQAGTMAHLPSMCLNQEEWNSRIREWIYSPDPKALLNSTIYFDLRHIYGREELVSGLKENIIDNIRKQTSFLNYLAKNAVENPPPISFFNQFIVETSGEHKNEFDIKKRAIMPLVDAGRLFALEHYYYNSVSTLDRFRYISQQESKNKAIFEEAVHGFEFLLKMRARTGLQHGDDGRYVDIGSFDNIEKKIFKEIFHIIRELQKIIQIRFQLDFFR